MIQAELEKDFEAYINTEANQIMVEANGPPSIIDPNGYILYLTKFTNDYSGEILYCYAKEQVIKPRCSKFQFNYNLTPDIFNGEINLTLAGYYHYEFYEVYWKNKPPNDLTNLIAPACELESCALTPEDDHGVVKGLVAIGKMYVAEEGTKPEVTYTEYLQPEKSNYIYQGK